MLSELLEVIENLQTDGFFTISICVVDNDYHESARQIVNGFSETSRMQVSYICEPQQNIALARNRAVENAKGNYVAFIDDDEIPSERWLIELYCTQQATSASGVLGPVLPWFEETPPPWIIEGKIFERPSPNTGQVLDWTDTRTGNALLSMRLFGCAKFNVAYGRGGEDKEFFRRMIALGNRFVWCKEAAVKEIIPVSRCSRSFLLKRALLRGKVSIPVPFSNLKMSLRSLIAIVVYLPLLLVLLAWSHGVFMKYLIKLFDHLGRLLAFFGLNVIRENYVC